MTTPDQAPETSDATLRALWNEHGGTFYSASRETASMPVLKLIPFLRKAITSESLIKPEVQLREMTPEEEQAFRARVLAVQRQEAVFMAGDPPPPAAPSPATAQYARSLATLVSAVCPGLDSGNLIEDAKIAVAAMASADPAAFFGVDDTGRYVQVKDEHAGDDDVFPMFLRAALKAEVDAPAAPTKPAKRPQGGAK